MDLCCATLKKYCGPEGPFKIDEVGVIWLQKARICSDGDNKIDYCFEDQAIMYFCPFCGTKGRRLDKWAKVWGLEKPITKGETLEIKDEILKVIKGDRTNHGVS